MYKLLSDTILVHFSLLLLYHSYVSYVITTRNDKPQTIVAASSLLYLTNVS